MFTWLGRNRNTHSNRVLSTKFDVVECVVSCIDWYFALFSEYVPYISVNTSHVCSLFVYDFVYNYSTFDTTRRRKTKRRRTLNLCCVDLQTPRLLVLNSHQV